MPNKNKRIQSRANAIATVWGTLAKDETFGGYTLAQFQQLQTDAQGKSATLGTLDAGYTDARMQRNAAHDALNTAMLNVVDGVKGSTAKYGANSSLYKAMGYVPRDERASGLTRKTTVTAGTGGTTTGTAKATASPAATVPTAATSGSVKN
jgi:hypothetical protein